MKEKIFKYLLEAGKGVPAAQILSDVLSIRSPNARSADSVLAGFLEGDPRFAFTENLWHLRSSPKESAFDFGKTAVLHLQSASRSQTLQGIRGGIRWADGRVQELPAAAPIGILCRLRSEIEGHLLIVWSRRELQLWNGLLRSQALEAWTGDKLYLRNLAARTLKRTRSSLQPEDLASQLGLSPPDEERPSEFTHYLSECWLLLLDRVPEEFRRNPDSLREWTEGPRTAVDFSRFAFGPDFLRQLPDAPGFYIMKNRAGSVIYVGKSRNLKRRVSSYFSPNALSRPKVARIHKWLHSIDVCRTENEVEALLMEMRLIKDFRPDINLQTEVHEQRAGRHQGRNLLLFVVGSGQDGVEIYFLRDGVFAGRHSAPLGRPPSKRLRDKLRSVFFAQGRRRKPQSEIWEREIVSQWFAANRKSLNYLDVDEAGDLESVRESLGHYLCDPDRLTRKVYYR